MVVVKKATKFTKRCQNLQLVLETVQKFGSLNEKNRGKTMQKNPKECNCYISWNQHKNDYLLVKSVSLEPRRTCPNFCQPASFCSSGSNKQVCWRRRRTELRCTRGANLSSHKDGPEVKIKGRDYSILIDCDGRNAEWSVDSMEIYIIQFWILKQH